MAKQLPPGLHIVATPIGNLGDLSPRAAETLLWLAQGKTNPNIATILGISESTIKKHVQEVFDKLGVETRGAAAVRALEALSAKSLGTVKASNRN